MWLVDRYGSLINTRHVISLYIGAALGDSSKFVVRANVYDPDNSAGEFAAQFTSKDDGSGMDTQGDAQALLDKLARLLGTVKPQEL